MAFSWLEQVLLAACVVGFALIPLLQAIPGNYVTFQILNNKRLPPGDALVNITGVTLVSECEEYCVKHPSCEAYAIKKFGRICQLHELVLGRKTVQTTGYVLYVRSKPESEGYYVSGDKYIKLMLVRKNFFQAQKECESMKGMIVAVRSKELNDLLVKLMTNHLVFHAFIGLTDVDKEGEWKYMDGGMADESVYTNWNDKGEWAKREKNCAVIMIDGTWRHGVCTGVYHYFCQIPMY